MPSRIIKESICSSDNLNNLPDDCEIFFYRLIVNCDDFGIMDARASILRAKCFPLRLEKVSEDDILNWLNILSSENVNLIFMYVVDGKRYLKLSKWENHQQIRASKSKYPLPSDTNSIILKSIDINSNQEISNVTVIQSNPIQSNIMSAKNIADDADAEKPKTGGAPIKTGKSEYSEDFETFWKRYPRTIEKKAAYKAWNTLLKNKIDPEFLILAASNYSKACLKAKTEVQFIKHPATFLGPNKAYEEYAKGIPLQNKTVENIRASTQKVTVAPEGFGEKNV